MEWRIPGVSGSEKCSLEKPFSSGFWRKFATVLIAIFNWRPLDICCRFVDVCYLVLFIPRLCKTKPMDCTLRGRAIIFPCETELDTVKGLPQVLVRKQMPG